MQNAIYFLISILSTTIGSLTGMGGGVIIKPLLDVMGDFNVATLGVLSSITVLAMTVVSVFRQLLQKTKIDFRTVLPLALGSILGGWLGDKMLNLLIEIIVSNQTVTIIQNSLLGLLISCVYLYMRNKHKIPGLGLKSIPISIFAGIFLGICASFLGIGGGPINVALVIYLFGYDTKSATVCSIVTILFAQLSKLASIAIDSGFESYDLSLLPVMVIGAVAGGYIGTGLNRNFKEKSVDKAFNAVQLLVLAISVYNIIKNLI